VKNKTIILAIVLANVGIFTFASSYVIPEGRQVVITQFGKPIKSVNEAGLHFKLPFIQKVTRID
jgi:membrane protease subunit HflC